MFNKLILTPAATFRERGISIPAISEADVADIVLKTMDDTLEEFGISHERLFERREPQTGDLVLEIGVCYYETKRLRNSSVVEYGEGVDFDLASRLGEALSDWGRCCSFGHQTAEPRSISRPGHLILKLFAINGTDSEQYLCRLTNIGRELSQAVASYQTDHSPRQAAAQAVAGPAFQDSELDWL